MEYFTEPERKTPIVFDVDVAVVGAGGAGVTAAVAAARNGAKTVLIDRLATLLSSNGHGLVSGLFNRYRTALFERDLQPFAPVEQIIAGIPWEIVQRMVKEEACRVPKSDRPSQSEEEALLGFRVECSPEDLQYVALEMVTEADVKLMLNTNFAESIVEDDAIRGIIVQNKSGRQAIRAKTVIDASGEADVAASAGVPCQKPGPGECSWSLLWLTDAMSALETRMGGQAATYGPSKEELEDLMKKCEESGEFRFEWEIGDNARLHYVPWHGSVINGLDATNGEDVTKAEIQARLYAFRFFQFLRKNMPGYEDVHIQQTGVQTLPRNGRWIEGEHTLTDQEILKGQEFEDSIFLYRKVEHGTPAVPSPYCQVPYRMLVPKKIDNLLVAGKCASGGVGIRGTVSCMAMGQAAGTAAALSLHSGVTPRKLNVKKLQNTLEKQGVILRRPSPVTKLPPSVEKSEG